MKAEWKSLLITDAVAKAITFIALAPLVGLVFRAFLGLSGQTALADTEIAAFLLHPLGWATLLIVGGLSLTVAAFEQAVLLATAQRFIAGSTSDVTRDLRFVAARAAGLFALAVRVIGRVVALTVPFLIVAGIIAWFCLTSHDINFYLSNHPPEFWIAAVSIGAIAIALVSLLIWKLAGWSIALPLYLFEEIQPSESLPASSERMHGQRRNVSMLIAIWFAATFLLSFAFTFLFAELSLTLVPRATASLWLLSICLGLLLTLWAASSLAVNMLGSVSLAVLIARIYTGHPDSPRMAFDDDLEAKPFQTSFRWTRGRVVACLVLAVGISAFVGIAAIDTAESDNEVAVTAHRGSSGIAPENTLAAVQLAIEEQADWVEIDVQETRDGVVVVAHDSDFKKVADNAVKVWEATAEELREIDIGSYRGTQFADERVPTLAEVLEACHDEAGVTIELKYYGHDQQLEQRVIDLVEAQGMEDQIVVMSLKAAGIAKIKELRPDWTVGLLTAVAAGDLTKADADFLAVNANLATRSFIDSAHARGKKVHVWTVNDEATMSAMIGRGADNLITDYPALARNVIQQREEMGYIERALIDLAYSLGISPNRVIAQ